MSQQEAAMQAQVAKFLIDNTDFELSDRVTSAQAERNLERRRMELMYRGVDPQKVEQHLAEMRDASAAEAIRELRLFFIYGRYAQKLEVEVTGIDVAEHIGQMAAQRGVTADAMRDQIVQADKLNVVRGQVRERKTIQAIIDKAKIKEVSADDFNAYVRTLREEEQPVG